MGRILKWLAFNSIQILKYAFCPSKSIFMVFRNEMILDETKSDFNTLEYAGSNIEPMLYVIDILNMQLVLGS